MARLPVESILRNRDGLVGLLRVHFDAIAMEMQEVSTGDWDARLVVSHLIYYIPHANIIIWEPEIWNLAMSEFSAFLGTETSDACLDAPPEYWRFNSSGDPFALACFWPDYLFQDESSGSLHGVFTWSQSSGNKRWRHCAVILDHNGLPCVRMVNTLGDIITWNNHAALCAAMEFKSLPFATPERVQASRHEQRRLDRQKMSGTVYQTLLRRAEPEAKPVTELSTDYSCQWYVRGHWRKQFYPSIQQHRPKFILPYVKGPDDKPFKMPSQSVAVVRR